MQYRGKVFYGVALSTAYDMPALASTWEHMTTRRVVEDAAFALRYVTTHAQTRAEQEAVIGALEQKCAILWAQLDAVDYAYVSPGTIPPGAFLPCV